MLLLATVLLSAFCAAEVAVRNHDPLLSGFTNASIVHSSGGKAVCASGDVYINITTTNTRLLFESPSNNTVATETIQELIQANPTIYARTNGGNNTFSARYRISAQLCYPANATDRKHIKTVQLLTHGLSLDHNYWDIPGFSYVDAAAAAGYATLNYDRLGVGQSEHPDPVQVVQIAAHAEVAHGLVQLLRAGALGGHAFGSVVGVGHSLGSIISTGVTFKYPRDFDAAVITGLSTNSTFSLLTIAALDQRIANTVNARFRGLADGYLTPSLEVGVQLAFWRWPYFAQSGSSFLVYRLPRASTNAASPRHAVRPLPDGHVGRALHDHVGRPGLARVPRAGRHRAGPLRQPVLRRRLHVPDGPGGHGLGRPVPQCGPELDELFGGSIGTQHQWTFWSRVGLHPDQWISHVEWTVTRANSLL